MSKKKSNKICISGFKFLLTLTLMAIFLTGCKKSNEYSVSAGIPTSSNVEAGENGDLGENFASVITSSESSVSLSLSGEFTEPVISKGEDPGTSATITDPSPEPPLVSDADLPPKANITWLDGLEIPDWDGVHPYAVINENEPLFDTSLSFDGCFENYYDLDYLGRCTLADAVVGPETQPTVKRGNISSVKPTGWHTDKYEFVNGESLYNRCHLIAYYLGAENANPYNLVTGTRYMNEDGMNDFENLTGDYIKETGNHVRYRVTPVWTENNLVCDGLLVEAWSIEDKGEGICFCIYCYNVQPGVYIDYKTGDNYAMDGNGKVIETPRLVELPLLEEDVEGTYILNVKKKKFHLPDCDGIADISDKNKEEYTGSRNALVLDGYVPCGGCNP